MRQLGAALALGVLIFVVGFWGIAVGLFGVVEFGEDSNQAVAPSPAAKLAPAFCEPMPSLSIATRCR